MMSSVNFPSSSSSVVAVGGKSREVGRLSDSSCSSSPRSSTHTRVHTHTPSADIWLPEIPEQDTVLVTQPPKP